ncbi:glycosyltransferase family 2 protein [Lacihabitans soyangensis]|uniref:Glycosyltransferase n=1 Tax=Lacihabitans soyangensis TaxID=869394 RepID=A0AAE3H7D6_9BACT|nr:glycosyltransferase family 2 protein [Lacihabitans soyangensis]MCP9765346.1 glycosyltransferase [Lacihabitans soyangensis]
MPLISIITITYNAQDFLERTLDSIRRQTSSDFEYILIDGGSKDGTMAIVEANKAMFSVIVSEKDKGLYDAMNKGLRKASGNYVWFMNAGDEIAEFDAIEKLKTLILKNPDIIYSDTMMVDNSGDLIGLRTEITPHKIPPSLSWKAYKMGMLICHQSFIARRSIAPSYIENNLSADIDWEIKCLKSSKSNLPYPGILAKYLEGGTSHQQLFKSWKDRYLVLKTHFGFFSNLWNHFKIILRADIFNIFRISKYIK